MQAIIEITFKTYFRNEDKQDLGSVHNEYIRKDH